jgi:hypothetical protein
MQSLNQSLWSIPTPDRIKRLPISPTGFYVPWFVQWFKGREPCDYGSGEPDFRVVDSRKMEQALRRNLCWICGGPLGVHRASVIGPMCALNRCISEPPSHTDCAEYAAHACPFLATPRAKRNEKDLPDERVAPSGMIRRNPGAIGVWVARKVTPFRQEQSILFRLGEPENVLWFAQGRKATRAEVLDSIDSGLPLLRAEGKRQGLGEAAVEEEIVRGMTEIERWLPAA